MVVFSCAYGITFYGLAVLLLVEVMIQAVTLIWTAIDPGIMAIQEVTTIGQIIHYLVCKIFIVNFRDNMLLR